MRVFEQETFDLPHVGFRHPPVIVAKKPEIDNGVGGDAPGEVDVGIDVAEREIPWTREDRLAAVQPRIAGARDRPPSPARTVREDHVVELVDRLEAQHPRRVAMLLEDHGC